MHIYMRHCNEKLVNFTSDWESNFDGMLTELISNREKNAVFHTKQELCSRFEINWVSF